MSFLDIWRIHRKPKKKQEQNEGGHKYYRMFDVRDAATFGIISALIIERVRFFNEQGQDKDGYYELRENLAKNLFCSIQTVYREIKKLKELGILEGKEGRELNFEALNDARNSVIKEDGKQKTEDTGHQSESDPKEIDGLIDCFKKSGINPTVSTWYKNKTIRSTADEIIQTYGFADLYRLVMEVIPTTNLEKFAPVITNMLQLKDKLPQLNAFLNTQEEENANLDPYPSSYV